MNPTRVLFKQLDISALDYISLPIHIKNGTDFSIIKYILTSISGPERFTFKSTKAFLSIQRTNCIHHREELTYFAKTDSYFHIYYV